jgi:hypothetical protein
MTSRILPLALVLATVFALTGCVSGSLGTYGDTRLSILETSIIPMTESDVPAILPLRSGGFAACVLNEEGEVTLTRFRDDLGVAWTTPIENGATRPHFGVGNEIQGTMGFQLPDPDERVLTLLETGDRIMLLSYRCRLGEPYEAIGRLFETSDGALVDSKTVYRAKFVHPEDPDRPDVSYDIAEELPLWHTALSPDSSRLVVYGFSPGANGPDVEFAVVDRSLALVRSGVATRQRAANPLTTSVHVDNGGRVHILRVNHTGGNFELETSLDDGTASIIETPALSSSMRIGSPRLLLEGDRARLFAIQGTEDGLKAIAVGAFDLARRTAEVKSVSVTPAILEKAIAYDELTFPYLHPVLTTDGATPYVLFIEKRVRSYATRTKNGNTGVVGSATGGDVLIVGTDDKGEPRWFNGIEKNVTFDDYRHGSHFHFTTIGYELTADAFVEVLYREGFTLRVRRIRLADGMTVGEDLPVIESTRSAFPLLSTATWLRDHAIVMYSKHGTFGADFFLNRVDY